MSVLLCILMFNGFWFISPLLKSALLPLSFIINSGSHFRNGRYSPNGTKWRLLNFDTISPLLFNTLMLLKYFRSLPFSRWGVPASNSWLSDNNSDMYCLNGSSFPRKNGIDVSDHIIKSVVFDGFCNGIFYFFLFLFKRVFGTFLVIF